MHFDGELMKIVVICLSCVKYQDSNNSVHTGGEVVGDSRDFSAASPTQTSSLPHSHLLPSPSTSDLVLSEAHLPHCKFIHVINTYYLSH
jgi:hypothetical protein